MEIPYRIYHGMDQMIKYPVSLGAPRSRIRSVINLLGKYPVKDKEGGE